jgi:hypothetical protein
LVALKKELVESKPLPKNKKFPILQIVSYRLLPCFLEPDVGSSFGSALDVLELLASNELKLSPALVTFLFFFDLSFGGVICSVEAAVDLAAVSI